MYLIYNKTEQGYWHNGITGEDFTGWGDPSTATKFTGDEKDCTEHIPGIGSVWISVDNLPKKYFVRAREVHIAIHEVEAHSPSEAINIVSSGSDTDIVAVEYSHTMDKSNWDVEDSKGNLVE